MPDPPRQGVHRYWPAAACLVDLAKGDGRRPAHGPDTAPPTKLFVDLYQDLYRDESPAKQRIWWTVYHGDRFTSLLLGHPHGFNDVYYGGVADPTAPPEHQFVFRCALVAGKVIDRNVGKTKPSFAKTIELDEEMNFIGALMPQEWWNLPDGLLGHSPELDSLRDRLLQQFYFFHVRTYLFLPFLKKSSPDNVTRNAARSFALAASEDPCREALQRFLLLRADVEEGVSLFDCKTSDFVAFTTAVVLVYALSASPTEQNAHRRSRDWELVSSVEEVFLRLERTVGCTMAAQCHSALSVMRLACSGDHRGPVDISIPFFGKVTMSPPQPEAVSTGANRQTTAVALTSSHPAQTESNTASAPDDQEVWEDTVPFFDVGLEITEWLSTNFAEVSSLGHSDSWFDMDSAMVGLDQDWATMSFATYA